MLLKLLLTGIAIALIIPPIPSPAHANEACRREYLSWLNSVDRKQDEDIAYAGYVGCQLSSVQRGQRVAIDLWVYLTTNDPGSQVNVRQSPSTASNRLGYGLADDFVHSTSVTRGEDGKRWFYVTFPNSGISGWIREDFIYYDLI